MDVIVQKMMDEDMQYQQMTRQKQGQAKQDMITSVNEKHQMKKR